MKNHVFVVAATFIAFASCDQSPAIVGTITPDAASSMAGDGGLGGAVGGSTGSAAGLDGGLAMDAASDIVDAPPDVAPDAGADGAVDVMADSLPDTRCGNGGMQTITLQPGPEGKDAQIFSVEPKVTAGSYQFLRANGWTWDGVPGAQRSLLQFDVPGSEQGTVVDAKLTLYADPVPSAPPSYTGHAALNGATNEAWLVRIKTPWPEEVSWSTQPSTVFVETSSVLRPADAVELPASQSEHQDYEIDVTAMVALMSAGTVPNHGFMLRMVTELPYRQMSFCSSDNLNPAVRPKLTIRYQLPGC